MDFPADGFAIYRQVIDAELITETRAHVERLQERQPDTDLLQLARMSDDPFWVRLVSDDRLLDIAEQYVGPDIGLFASGYFCKSARTGKPVLWHQDGSYWPLEPMEAVTLWLAVDDSTPENGCMRVIPGSHRGTLAPLEARSDVDNMLGSGMLGHVDERAAADVVLRAGDVSIHHPNLIHGSEANRSDQRRCGLAIRYIASSTRIVLEALSGSLDAQGRWPAAFHLRGDPGTVNQWVSQPG